MKKTEDLVPYAQNSRTHSAHQVNKIADSIKEFGFINPVIIDKKQGIIAGHGRVMAAKQLELKKFRLSRHRIYQQSKKKLMLLLTIGWLWTPDGMKRL